MVGRHGGLNLLMVSGLGSRPGQGRRVEIWDKLLYCHSAYFHAPVEIITVSGTFSAGG